MHLKTKLLKRFINKRNIKRYFFFREKMMSDKGVRLTILTTYNNYNQRNRFVSDKNVRENILYYI